MSPELPLLPSPPPPWREFLLALDRLLPRKVDLHCLGGFVLAMVHGSPRPTGDLDHVATIPQEALAGIQ